MCEDLFLVLLLSFFLNVFLSFSQVLGESLYISRKFVDFEKKFVMAQSKVETISSENDSLKKHISALSEKAKVDKDYLKTLKKSIDTKKAFTKLKEKQIDEALQKIKKGWLEGSREVQSF